MSQPRIYIFDIDGVLLDGLADALFVEAMEDWFAPLEIEADWEQYPVINDIEITKVLFEQRYSRPAKAGEIEAALDFVFERISALLQDGSFRDRPMPGGPEMIERLTADPAHILALATAGLERLQRLRLRHQALEEAFHTGAFAEHGRDKSEILAAAIAACRQIVGFEVARSEIVYFGDRPSDCHAARHAGVRFIGVASSAQGRERLLDAGAEIIVSDLRQASSAIAIPG